MNAKFKIETADLICVQIEGVPQHIKLGEIFNGDLEFEDIKFLNEIYCTSLVTDELLSEARLWFEQTVEHR